MDRLMDGSGFGEEGSGNRGMLVVWIEQNQHRSIASFARNVPDKGGRRDPTEYGFVVPEEGDVICVFVYCPLF